MTRGVWSADTVSWVLFAALLPTIAIIAVEQGSNGILRLALAAGVIAFWQVVFAIARGIPPSPSGAITAVAVAVLAPGPLGAWQIVLAVSFGTVIGELIFGGWGRNFLSTAVITLAFLYFSFSGVPHEPAGPWIVLATVPAALMLLATGILSWRVVAAAAIGFLAVSAGFDQSNDSHASGALAFGLVFLVGDPVAAASTNTGRLVYGALAGGLAGLFGAAAYGFGAPQSVVFAALLASVFAPLIDHGVIETRLRLEPHRHG